MNREGDNYGANCISGIRPLYSSVKGSPNEIEIRIRMRDLIDPSALRMAVDMTMKRYPYFCVELQKKNGQYVFADNHRPVTVSRCGFKFGRSKSAHDFFLMV